MGPDHRGSMNLIISPLNIISVAGRFTLRLSLHFFPLSRLPGWCPSRLCVLPVVALPSTCLLAPALFFSLVLHFIRLRFSASGPAPRISASSFPDLVRRLTRFSPRRPLASAPAPVPCTDSCRCCRFGPARPPFGSRAPPCARAAGRQARAVFRVGGGRPAVVASGCRRPGGWVVLSVALFPRGLVAVPGLWPPGLSRLAVACSLGSPPAPHRRPTGSNPPSISAGAPCCL